MKGQCGAPVGRGCGRARARRECAGSGGDCKAIQENEGKQRQRRRGHERNALGCATYRTVLRRIPTSVPASNFRLASPCKLHSFLDDEKNTVGAVLSCCGDLVTKLRSATAVRGRAGTRPTKPQSQPLKRSFWTWNGVGCSWPGATNSRNGSRILTATQKGVCRQKSKGDLIQVKTSRRAPAILLPLTPRGGGARCSA
jgi:hypothetical protein